LRISQALYSEVFDNSPLQIFVQEVLPNGGFPRLRTNPAHQRASGMPPEKIWGKTMDELVIPEVAQAINQHYQRLYSERACDRVRRTRVHLLTGIWSGSAPSAPQSLPSMTMQGNVVRLVGASRRYHRPKASREIIMQRTREEAVTAERSRLARELHDAVTQTLFSTTLTAEVLPKIWEKDPQEGQKKLAELRELTRGALAEMRTLLMELRPDALADAELKDLLRHLTNAFIARARIPIQVTVEGCVELPLAVKIAFYRVAQEALNNIAKHSEANQVALSLKCQDEILVELIVQDDGRDLTLTVTPGADHFGLRIMQERAEQIGARLEIKQPGWTGNPGENALVWSANRNTDKIGKEK
jgi:signal transduction histidine kinase